VVTHPRGGGGGAPRNPGGAPPRPSAILAPAESGAVYE
jgi:hypothetical protein